MTSTDSVTESVVPPADGEKRKGKSRKKRKAKGKDAGTASDDVDDIIKNGVGDHCDGDKKKAIWMVVNTLLRRGYYEAAIKRLLSDKNNRISLVVEKLDTVIADAIEGCSLSVDDNGKPHQSPANIRLALLKLGVRVRYNEFSDKTLITGLDGLGPVVDDAVITRLWLLADERFRVHPGMDLFYRIVADTARLNPYHPVRDKLASLKWDGKPRLDKWLTTYGGAESSPYVDAVGAIVLIAAVRRVRYPGVKFDEMLILEGAQGKDKSTALQVLALNPDWFTDDLPLDASGKRFIEAVQGRWIIEAGELSGMTRADISQLKGLLARLIDRGRMAYGRLPIEWPRQCVIIGTTNSKAYLKDLTGNRRYWPVGVIAFDIETLKREREQLWAEAAAREARGDSIRLDPSLWEAAGEEQDERTIDDPYFETLRDSLGAIDRGKIAKDQVWQILQVLDVSQRTTVMATRLTEAMLRLGWSVPKNRTISHNGAKAAGFTKGEPPWPAVADKDLKM